MTGVRFDGQVAVVTGAGRNLGRAYAVLLAERGAKVVVNDLGVAISDTDGTGQPPMVNPALGVVEEIKAAGGEAVASTESISEPAGADAIIALALDEVRHRRHPHQQRRGRASSTDRRHDARAGHLGGEHPHHRYDQRRPGPRGR